MRASVVIPTRNREALLADTLQSLFKQDFPAGQFEIVVVDDGSTDSTPDLVQDQADRADVSIRYLVSTVGGPNAARNVGIRASESELICFIDDDVDLPAGWLTELVDATTLHPEVECFGGRIYLRLEGRSPRICSDDALGETELDLGDEVCEARFVWSANMCVRRSAFDQVGLFNEQIPHWGDETEWEVRYKAAGGIVLYIPSAYLWHRRTETDLKLSRLVRSRFRRGIVQARNANALGYRVSVAGALWNSAMGLRHFVLRRCWAGFFHFLTSLGATVYTVSRLLARSAGKTYSWLPH